MTDTPTQDQSPPPRAAGALDDVFERLHRSDVRRDTDHRWFGGVCSGLAARFGVDPLLIRAAAIALTIAGGVGVPVYLVLWLALPDTRGTVLVERAVRHGDAWAVVLGVVTALFVVGGLLSLGTGNDHWGGSLWLLLPVGLVVWLLVNRSRSGGHQQWGEATGYAPYPAPPGAPVPPPPPGGTPMSGPTSSFAPPASAMAAPVTTGTAPYGSGMPAAPPTGYGPWAPPRPPLPPAPPRPRRRRPSGYVGLVSLGLAAALVGLGVVLAGPLGFPGEPVLLGLTLALAGTSLVVLGLALTGRASGFSGFLTVALTLATVFGVLVAHSPAGVGGTGDRTWTPTAAVTPVTYTLGVGDATLDLTNLTDLTAAAPGADAPLRVSVQIGAGSLRIEVPPGLDVRVENSVGAGTVSYGRPGSLTQAPQNGDPGTDFTYDAVVGAGGTPDVVVTTEVGLGDITIEEQ
ncbi:PspC domain-containing protein [Phycicoccus duodecadis]|nr:PspC domain-containing protein [Phycicoccus duodecadis]